MFWSTVSLMAQGCYRVQLDLATISESAITEINHDSNTFSTGQCIAYEVQLTSLAGGSVSMKQHLGADAHAVFIKQGPRASVISCGELWIRDCHNRVALTHARGICTSLCSGPRVPTSMRKPFPGLQGLDVRMPWPQCAVW